MDTWEESREKLALHVQHNTGGGEGEEAGRGGEGGEGLEERDGGERGGKEKAVMNKNTLLQGYFFQFLH